MGRRRPGIVRRTEPTNPSASKVSSRRSGAPPDPGATAGMPWPSMTGLRTELQNTETPPVKPDRSRPLDPSIRPPTHNRVEQDFLTTPPLEGSAVKKINQNLTVTNGRGKR